MLHPHMLTIHLALIGSGGFIHFVVGEGLVFQHFDVGIGVGSLCFEIGNALNQEINF